MNNIAQKLARVAQELVDEKGTVDLFALFMREDFPEEWDLVLSAPWALKDRAAAIRYVAEKVSAKLKVADRMPIGRIVILNEVPARLAKQLIRDSNKNAITEHGPFLFRDIPIKRAFIVALKQSRPRKTAPAVA